MITLQKFITFSRPKAFGLHLCGSLTAISVIWLAVAFIWYPDDLFWLAKGNEMLKIIAAVDVVLGPLILVIIFNKEKKSLKKDVLIIFACQLAFLAYGCWSLFAARPAYLAFDETHFKLATANEIEIENQNKVSKTEFKSMPLFGPLYVDTRMPSELEERDLIALLRPFGLGIQHLPQHFTPIEHAKEKLLAAARPISSFNTMNKELMTRIFAFENTQKQNGVVVKLIPLELHRFQSFVAIDAKSGKPLKVLSDAAN